jgi:hypothetical protein
LIWHLDAHVSLRGIGVVLLSLLDLLRLLLGWRPLRLPCPQTVRTWLLRVGLFLLRRALPKRSDWVWILDHTIRIGQHKCLLILGVSLQRLRNLPGALEHRDVVVLDLQVTTSCTGESVAERFAAVAERVGVPQQIVCDHGADLAKGVRLFQADHPEVIDTSDVTHQLACLVKRVLGPDARWAEFLRRCTACLFALQQSAGAFLLPATARSRSRYLNVGPPIAWAQRMVMLLESPDLTEIAVLLKKDEGQTRAFLEEKVGWVREFREDVAHYDRLLEVVQSTQQEVKTRGLGAATAERVWEQLPATVFDDPRLAGFLTGVRSYLEEQGGKVPKGECWLGTSDVIESLFGKYKWLGEKAPYAEVGANVLTLPVMTVDLTSELIREALSTVSVKDVREWVATHIGRSTLSKVKAANKAVEAAERDLFPGTEVA